MFDPERLDEIASDREAWEEGPLAEFLERSPEQKEKWTTHSAIPVKRVYTPEDVADIPYEDIGFPGEWPFTRGPYPTMYRGRTWTMRQIAGYGTGSDTNERFKYLISQGQTGLSIDFDMPTLMGYDSDHSMSLGEVGREGVAIDTIEDMRDLFEGIDLESISVSMTINPTAWILFAMYVAVAEERGDDLGKLSGTLQADMLKEYVAQKEWIYPVDPSLRLVRDIVVHSSRNLPRFNPISISGYHISEAGSTATQEVALTLAHGAEYVDMVRQAGIDVDDFAPRLSFFFVSQRDFFEEVAKFRAARRLWARMMRDRFGATTREAARLRFHCQTAAATLTKAEPENNIVRTAFQALAAVLGGAQSLHCNGFDEAYAIPTEEAMRIALRTQQIISDETGVTSVVDPMGGSYYVESLTNDIEKEATEIMEEISRRGGVRAAIDEGYPQLLIADSAYDQARMRSKGDYVVVGVNKYVSEAESPDIEVHKVSADVEQRQTERVRSVREGRDTATMERLLDRLASEASDPDVNLMPVTIDLVRAGATLGEIVEKLVSVFGRFRERPRV